MTLPERTVRVLIAALLSLASVGRVDADEPAPEAAPEPAIAYAPAVLFQLRVADLDESIAFYRDVLELELVLRSDELRWAKLQLPVAGVTIGIGEADVVEGSGTASINIGVRDIDAARARLESKGVSFAGPTLLIPGVVRLADFEDPDGNRIRLAGGP